MHINSVPEEILAEILTLAAKANEADGPTFSYGLVEVESQLQPYKTKPSKYVRGPLSPQDLRWHNSSDIRQVCSQWHNWALTYTLEHLMVQMWRGEQRWLELPRHIKQYSSYEIMDRHLGHVVWCPGHTSLEKTDQLLTAVPSVGAHIRRLWFNGLHLAKTDKHIMSIISRCPELRFLSAPWTILRRGTSDDWKKLLKADTPNPLFSLELQSVCLRSYKAEALANETPSRSPLDDPSVDFSKLKRLKIFGNTVSEPVSDRDLLLMARTATNLESLDITNNSTTTVAGMLALVKASRSTLQVLEHSPRSDDGFFHPFPGKLSDNQHICAMITDLPKMRDLSLSVPHMCHELFQDTSVNWMGECQVRTSTLCPCAEGKNDTKRLSDELRLVLNSARALISERARMHCRLSLELFFDHCIFDPERRVVHGDFVLAEVRSNGQWPLGRQGSTKGPFGTSGTYGKNDSPWDAVSEDEYFRALEKGWITL